MEEQINRLEFKNKVDGKNRPPTFSWHLPPDENLAFTGIFPVPVATFYFPSPEQILNAVKSFCKDYNENFCRKKNNTLIKNFELYHRYFYNLYFKSLIDNLIKKYKFPNLSTTKKEFKVKLKTADRIRIENSSAKLETIKEKIIRIIPEKN